MTYSREEKLQYIKANADKTADQIASHLGCSKSNICNIASENDLPYAQPFTRRGYVRGAKKKSKHVPAGCFNVDAYAKSGY